MTESEIAELYQALRDLDTMGKPLPKSILDLRAELWYLLTEVCGFNAYLEQGGRP